MSKKNKKKDKKSQKTLRKQQKRKAKQQALEKEYCKLIEKEEINFDVIEPPSDEDEWVQASVIDDEPIDPTDEEREAGYNGEESYGERGQNYNKLKMPPVLDRNFAAHWGHGDIFDEQTVWFNEQRKVDISTLQKGDIVESFDGRKHRWLIENIGSNDKCVIISGCDIDSTTAVMQYVNFNMPPFNVNAKFNVVGHTENMQIGYYLEQEKQKYLREQNATDEQEDVFSKRMPKNKWTKKIMIETVVEYCNVFNLVYNAEQLAETSKQELFDTFLFM